MARPETIQDIKEEWRARPEVIMSSSNLDMWPEAQQHYAQARKCLMHHGMRIDDDGNIVRPRTEQELEEILMNEQRSWDSNLKRIANYDGEEIEKWQSNILTKFAEANGLECPNFNIKNEDED